VLLLFQSISDAVSEWWRGQKKGRWFLFFLLLWLIVVVSLMAAIAWHDPNFP
jgi:uncharacterized membrane protein